MAKKIKEHDVLDYHQEGRPGKIEVVPTKPSNSQRDLSIAYSPGVAIPCQKIAENPDDVYHYTGKGNLVAVISNGTAVLGLGDIGPEASKPVMEGKAVLFKIFADIDVFDLELNARDPEVFIQTVKALEPTFGGINLEDIKAPESFAIEQRLKEELDIPVMHDDQHGTAIISSAALLNALLVVEKKIEEVQVVFNGAGGAAISCARLFKNFGVAPENLKMLDSQGVITKNRENLSPEKAEFAIEGAEETLAEAMHGADVFVGLSKGGLVSAAMVQSMADNPIVFALANPDPEISYQEALAAREDIVMATGRSDNPNQVNNVLGFPFIFRGALDVRARKINERMKMAAARALAELAREPVPEIVNLAYNEEHLQFGRQYIIPKPFDPRLIYTVAPAVARAAMESGSARKEIQDWEAYKNELISRLGRDDKFIRLAQQKAQSDPKRVVLPEGEHIKVLKAAQMVQDEGLAKPILLGRPAVIHELIAEYGLDLPDVPIIDPFVATNQTRDYAEKLFALRQRDGLTLYDASKKIRDRNYFGAMMVAEGEADALVSGISRKYTDVVQPLFEIIGPEKGCQRIAGMYIMLSRRGPLFFADTTLIENPSAEDIVEIALQTARTLRRVNIEPRIALLSYSNYGSSRQPEAKKMKRASKLLREQHPELVVDGEMQANFALNKELLEENFPFSPLVEKQANVFIFPNLAAGNIAYKLLQSFNAAEALGPMLIGIDKAAHVLQMGASVREIVNMITLATVDAQTKKSK